MNGIEKKTVSFIILINPMLDELQAEVEREQKSIIADMSLSAYKTAEMLIALDNRRIDLCNLNVLYGFIECGLGDRFELLRSCVQTGTDCMLYKVAAQQIRLAGYTPDRVRREFEYLFKAVNRKRRKSAGVGKTYEQNFMCLSG